MELSEYIDVPSTNTSVYGYLEDDKYTFKINQNKLNYELDFNEEELKSIIDIFNKIRSNKYYISERLDTWKEYINALCKDRDYVVYYYITPYIGKRRIVNIDKYNSTCIEIRFMTDENVNTSFLCYFQDTEEIDTFLNDRISLENQNGKIMERIDYHIRHINSYLTSDYYDLYYKDDTIIFNIMDIVRLNNKAICIKEKDDKVKGYHVRYEFSSYDEVDEFFNNYIKIIERDTLENVIDDYIEKIKNKMKNNKVIFEDSCTNIKRSLHDIGKVSHKHQVDVKIVDSNGVRLIKAFSSVDSVKEFFENNIYIQSLNYMFK